jgi:hypothetical protein
MAAIEKKVFGRICRCLCFPDRRHECEEAVPRSAASSWVKDITYIRKRETDTEIMNK